MDNATVQTAGWAAVYAAGATAFGGVIGIYLQQKFIQRGRNESSLVTERQSLLSGMQVRLESAESGITRLMEVIKDLQESLRDCEALHRDDVKERHKAERRIELLDQEKDVLLGRIRKLELLIPPTEE